MIKNLGNLKGQVVLFGGIYSNLQAFQGLLDEVARINLPISNLIHTGDCIAYCANPSECVDLLQNSGAAAIKGNCEIQIAENADDCGCGFEEGSTCSLLSQEWYPFAKSQLSEKQRQFLGSLPNWICFEHEVTRYGVIHGGVNNVSRFLWSVSDDAEFLEEWSHLEAIVGEVDVLISGHSGIAFSKTLSNGKLWVNAGVIGMPPHGGRSIGQYVKISEKGIKIKELSYDVEAAAHAMEAAGLTQGYHHGLRLGYWPSQDILPAELRV